MDLPPPPSFAGAELQRFDVPEGCHICFLHLGFQDPAPRCDPVLATPDSTASRRAFPGGAVAAANFTFPRDDNIPDYDDLASDHEEDESGPGHASRGFMRDHCPRSGEARYAIKHVRSDLGGGGGGGRRGRRPRAGGRVPGGAEAPERHLDPGDDRRAGPP